MSDETKTEDKRIDLICALADAILLFAGFIFIGLFDWKLAIGLFIVTGKLNARIMKIQKKLGIE